MDIKTLSSALGQQLRPDNKGADKSGEDSESEFGQLLQTVAAKINKRPDQQEDLLTTAPGAAWLQLLLTPYSQQLDEQLPTPDLALSPNTGEQEEGSAEDMISASLTEIMAALQPLLSQSNTPLLPQLSDSSDETVQFNLAITDEVDKANATTLLGLLTAISQADAPVSPDEAEQLLNAADTLLTQSQSDAAVTGNIPGNDLRSRGVVEANLQAAQMVDIPAAPNAATGSTPAALDAVEPSPNHQAAPNTPLVTGELPPQPQAGNSTELPPVAVQPAMAPVAVPLTGSGAANVEFAPAFQLPNIPALHQIVDSVGILTQQGQTEVRLHLQPESLGQVWVQLHIVDGNVAVHMLAETSQAQALIQDHLAQLKMAFATQGLQVDGLSVAVGQDTSAFDLPGRASNGGSNRSNRQQPRLLLEELEQVADSRPTASLWGALQAVDYKV